MSRPRSAGKPQRWICGPFEGVRDAVDAGSQDHEKFAQDAVNCYLADTRRGRSLYARPGVTGVSTFLATTAANSGTMLHHTTTDGTEYRFVLAGAALYRISADLATNTAVTPTGTAISTTYRPSMISFGDTIIVNDGVDRPWIMSNLSATPVTRTYIDYNGAGAAWTAWGRPTVAAGKLVFVCNSLNGVTARNAIMWSEEAAAATGYQQAGYDNLWELTQSDTDALTAIVGTNSGIVVFREDSITRIEGLNVDQFQTSATFDGISTTVGCPYWATVTQVGRHIWFVGRDAKVFRLSEDGTIDEPWRDMALTITRKNAESGAPASLAMCATGAYHADLDTVVFALWKDTNAATPCTLYVFDGSTGRHCGRWQIGEANLEDEDAGALIYAMAPLKDSTGRYNFCFLAQGGTTYTIRRMRLLSESVWTDSSAFTSGDSASQQYCVTAVRTHLMGDDPSGRVVVDRVVTEHPWDPDVAADVVKLKYHTPKVGVSSQLTATLRINDDRTDGTGVEVEVPGHARATFGLGPNAQGRWVRITSSATFAALTTPTSNVQFGFERVIVFGQIVPDMDEY